MDGASSGSSSRGIVVSTELREAHSSEVEHGHIGASHEEIIGGSIGSQLPERLSHNVVTTEQFTSRNSNPPGSPTTQDSRELSNTTQESLSSGRLPLQLPTYRMPLEGFDHPEEHLPGPSKPTIILPLLHCGFCSALLRGPTTLRCGHAVCSHHVRSSPHSSPERSPPRQPPSSSLTPPDPNPRPSNALLNRLPSCPIPSCTFSSSAQPFHVANPPPMSSRVAYYPPPAVGTSGNPPEAIRPRIKSLIRVPHPKHDVTLSRVLDLVVGATREKECRMRNNDHGSDGEHSADGSTSEDESDVHPLSNQSAVDTFERIGRSQSRSPRRSPPSSATRQPTERLPSPSTTVASSSLRRLGSSSDLERSQSSRRLRDRTPPSSDHSPESASGSRSHRPKRRRLRRPGSSNHTTPHFEAVYDASFTKALYAEMQCEICFSLLHKPITTPCQHTFCASCLSRTLDHSTQCPLCRQDMPGYSYFHEHAPNSVITSIILRAFSQEYNERQAAIDLENRNSRLDTPIFVCQLSFPGMPTLLHIFEPRYRLLLRRCLQSPNPCFGMVLPPGSSGSTCDYGTMLEVLSVQMLPDGRSMVETKGTHRFRILERGILDGYVIARTERLDDYDPSFESDFEEIGVSFVMAPRPPPERVSPPLEGSQERAPRTLLPTEQTNEELMSVCRDFYEQLRSGAAPWVVQQLNTTYGTMPDHPGSFSFWMALLLPIDDREKAKLLPIRSPRLRLLLIVHWIQSLNNSWWYGSGCVVA